jgi:hypothetical protein
MSRTVAAGAFLLALSAARVAAAGTPTGFPGTKVWVDEPVDQQHNSNIIYMNRCAGGCTITPGNNSSVNNTSPIIGNSVRNISAFNGGNATWNAVLECVRQMYEPFNIVVTDVDPSPAAHYEAIVAGTPGQIGQPSGICGVAPYTCGVINNAISFSFGNYCTDVDELCVTVAQETAHAFGLDHEFHCQDNMTYLSGCGLPSFTDFDSRCGEYAARNCCTSSGPATQNSYQRILDVFGPSDPTPPTVDIVSPTEGSRVDPGYPVRANVTDNTSVARVELWVNNQRAQILMSAPWAFNAPANLPDGVHLVEVRAYDNQGTLGTGTVHVTQGNPCATSDDCGDALACVDGGCVPGPTADGGLGHYCDNASDCVSELCVFDGDNHYCTWPCQSSCADGFGCQDGYCTAGVDNPSGGGCRAGSDGRSLWVGLGLGAVLLGLRRRRRR